MHRVLFAVGLGIAAAAAADTPAPATTLAPPAALVADGMPAIPSSLRDEVGRYTEARSAGFADWHPVEHQLLISTRFGNTNQIHRVKMPGGDRTQLTFFPEPVAGALYEPVTGRFFLFRKDHGGDEFFQIYRYDVTDGAVTMITDGGRSQNGGMVWSTKGDRIAYGSTRRNGADRDIYVMAPGDPKSDRRVLEVAGGGWQVADWSPDDSRLLVSEGISVNESTLWSVDLATGAKTRVSPEGTEKVAWSAALFHPDGRQVYVVTDRGEEFAYLGLLDPASGKVKRLSAARAWDVDGLELTHDGRTLAYTINEGGISKLVLLDTASGRERPVSGIPVGVMGNMGFHRDGTRLAFSLAGARTPSDIYVVDVAGDRVERWTESETGGMVPDRLRDPELIRWKSFDGREITGFLYKPPARFAGKRPVIVNVHGGPEGQSVPVFLGRWNYFLAELGVAVVFPNVRGSTGYGKSFVKLDNGVLREDTVKDVGALLDWIGTRPDLDAGRVVGYGGSYGGYMSLAIATTFADRIRGSIDVVGISNFISFLENTESYRRDLRRVEYGDERDPEIRAFFQRIGPLFNAGKITKPLFVIQGANDPRVPRGEAEQVVATARKNGTPVWYLLGKDEGHGFQKKDNADFQFFAMAEFVKKYLLPEAPVAAAR